MKCSHCGSEIHGDGMVVSLILHGTIYTTQLHMDCLAGLIGAGNARKLRNRTFEDGWMQLGLRELSAES